MCRKCLYCYQPLKEEEGDFHTQCSRKIFGTPQAPVLPYKKDEIEELAKAVVKAQTTLTGVQPKLSLDIDRMSQAPKRFTIVGLWGSYILKPPTAHYPFLPELEDLTMHLAELAKIKTVPHSLIKFNDGELCYITRRIDRTPKGEKIAMEDMCQLSERLTEDKYKGSHERIAKLINQHSAAPLLDVIRYWEIVVFCWIIGNADMHLKNYSLYAPDNKNYELTPAYDLLSTALVMPEDTEELALTLRGKKRKLSRHHFTEAMLESGISTQTADNIIRRFIRTADKWEAFIGCSFLPEEMKRQYVAQIRRKIKMLNPI